MKHLYNLACSLVAWSALSMTARSEAGAFSIDSKALQPRSGKPDQFCYLRPDVALSRYHSILIAPLVYFSQDAEGHWKAFVTGDTGPGEPYREALAESLQAQGFRIARSVAPGVLRLRTAVGGTGLASQLPAERMVDLQHDQVDSYLRKVSSLGHLEDALSGELLAGGVDLREQMVPRPVLPLEKKLRLWGDESAQRVRELFAEASGRLVRA